MVNLVLEKVVDRGEIVTRRSSNIHVTRNFFKYQD